jgi:hypothetical protein
LVIGAAGSGKTLATEVLKADFGYAEINSGRVVAQLINVPPIPETPRHEFQEKAWAFISDPLGPERLAKKLLEIGNALNTPRILIDGLAARSADVEGEVEGLISIADAVLYNWTGRLQYRETIKALMSELGTSEVPLT